MTKHPYAFEARIVPHSLGTYCYTVVFLPQELAEVLPFDQQPRLRIRGVFGGVPFSGAWQPSHGRWYLMLSKLLMARSGYRVGDMALVRFALDDPAKVDVPEALRQALLEDPEATEAWNELTPGKQRALAHHVWSAKTDATRAKRLEGVLWLLHSETPGDLYALTRRQSRQRRASGRELPEASA